MGKTRKRLVWLNLRWTKFVEGWRQQVMGLCSLNYDWLWLLLMLTTILGQHLCKGGLKNWYLISSTWITALKSNTNRFIFNDILNILNNNLIFSDHYEYLYGIAFENTIISIKLKLTLPSLRLSFVALQVQILKAKFKVKTKFRYITSSTESSDYKR